VWDAHAMWQPDPVMLPFEEAAKNVRFFGYAGPPNGKASEAYSKYVVVDLFAKAIQGMPAEDSAKWAEAEVKKIYG
jgi:multiple sugar transport system substrate-binding protein